MKDFNELEKKLHSINKIEKSYKEYFLKIKDPKCDKKGIGFNKDSRFSCISIPVSIDSKYGYYGSSDTYQAIFIDDKKTFETHFIKVLNKYFGNIINETIESVKKELSENKEKAIEDLEKALNELKQL